MIGVVIPPVAINVFIVKQITKIPMGIIYQGVYPFLISLVVGGFFSSSSRGSPPGFRQP